MQQIQTGETLTRKSLAHERYVILHFQLNTNVSKCLFTLTTNPALLRVCFFAYQGIKHQRIKSVTVRVLHHDVEESIQSVLQKLE